MILLNNKELPAIKSGMNRRKFITMGLAIVTATFVPKKILAAVKDSPAEKKLSFYNIYSHENLETVYWKDGQFVPGALSMINHIFRDSRTGKVKAIKTDLLDVLFDIRRKLKNKEPFHIISGYRTPHSNALLRKRKKGVAKNSLHMYGKAVDISLPGYSTKALRRTAMSLRRGGVGYYPRSKFVHVDVGQVRYWWG
ncbi:MAG TPA: DUF882 domain-containing protein [Nitrospirae bacterium]|nr:peptidase M15 [bacterium BMS3Abin06]HDH11143.1 DUF882 domain-containing protein [Nitrospirota bacterium]HDZ02622.1 DUF882 domain-containing protein [Nitrospirota bacterium]